MVPFASFDKWRIILFGVLALVLSACSGKPERIAASPDLGFRMESREFGTGLFHVMIPGVRFQDRIVTPAPIFLDREYILEFLPLTEGEPDSAPVQTKLYVRAEGKEKEVGSYRTISVRSKEFTGFDRFRALDRRVRVDLSAYRGKRIDLKWVLDKPGRQAGGMLGLPLLRPKKFPSTRPPDVLLICSDTHRYDFSFGKAGRVLMPALHSLMAESVVYRRAYSAASWTLPSVTSMLTGLFPRYHRTGARTKTLPAEQFTAGDVPKGQFGWKRGRKYQLFWGYPAHLQSLPEVLRRAGYTTVVVASNPLYRLSGLSLDGTDLAVSLPIPSGEVVNRYAEHVIRHASPEAPLFLLVHYMDVHQWKSWYFKKQFPKADPEQADRELLLDSYADAVSDADCYLKALLEFWKARRNADKTLVVFCADHGEHLRDPVIGHGRTMSDVLLHIPLLIKYPASARRNPGVVNENVSLVDVTPTVLDAAGIRRGDMTFSGRSLLQPGDNHVGGQRDLFADYQLYGDPLSSIRRGEWKLVINLKRKNAELVRIRRQREPGGNRLLEAKRMKASLMKAFERYVADAGKHANGFRSRRSIDQGDAMKALKALGYVH